MPSARSSQDPVEVQVVRFGTDGAVTPITEGVAVHNALIGGPPTVITRSAVDAVGTTVMVHREGTEPAPINVVSEMPPHQSVIRLMKAGKHELRTAVLLPRDHQTGSAKLPVLMDPYGGPYAQRVVASARAFLEAQWLADQGFCVIVCDGRGTPGRGHDFERAMHNDFASMTMSTPLVSASPAGPSAATCPLSRSCGDPTCSTRPSPVPR